MLAVAPGPPRRRGAAAPRGRRATPEPQPQRVCRATPEPRPPPQVFVLAHFLFWNRVYTATNFDLHRLYTDNHFSHDGGIPSGPSGSGIFPIALLLMVTVTVVVGAKAIVFVPEK